VGYDLVLKPIFSNRVGKLNWFYLWVKKSDYIEKYYGNIRDKYDIIDESINYYIGMLEKGINYLKDYKNYYSRIYIQHDVILADDYSDFDIKYDVKERDLTEYLKYLFFFRKYENISEVYSIIEQAGTEFNYELIVARLLLPTHYFQAIEKYLKGENNFLIDVVERIDMYEQYVNSIVKKINNFYNKKIVLPF